MKIQRVYQPETHSALTTVGLQIGIARREIGWTANDFAERLGVTRALVARIEKGAPTVAIGTVFEAAVICGVPLFNRPRNELADIAEMHAARFAVLPARVRAKDTVDDDF